MTTNNIGGFNPNLNRATMEKPKGNKQLAEEQVQNQGTPAAKEESYQMSTEAKAALAASSNSDIATMDEVGTKETDKETSYKIDKDAVLALKEDFAKNEAAFMQKMMGMIQGQATAAFQGMDIWSMISSGQITVTPEEQAEAAESISEDGYWGVEQTATRIVDMAKALVGNDPDKADDMMAAIEKGFEAAEKAWGGELPSITGDTKARIDELFAQWKEESASTAVTG